MIQHFTSYDAFRSILETATIRLNCVQNMNDSSEIKVLIDDIYHFMLCDDRFSQSQKVGLHQFFRDFEDETRFFKNDLPSASVISRNEPQFFSLSCTYDGDCAKHWLCYGKQGEGIAICFSEEYLKSLRELLLSNGIAVDLAFCDVIYAGTREYEELIARLSDRIKEAVLGERSDDGNVWYDALDDLLENAHFVKSAEFSFENEVRLSLRCFLDNRPIANDLLTYEQNEANVSRFLLNLPKNGFIKRVIIGPKLKIQVQAVEGLLAKNGFQGVEVIKSSSALQ